MFYKKRSIFKSFLLVLSLFVTSLFFSCGGSGSSSDLTSSNQNGEPIIKAFSISPTSINSPFTMNLSWNIDDPNHQYACKVDFEGDGVYDYETNDCSTNNSITHKFDDSGVYTIKLAIVDKNTNEVKKITTVTITISSEEPTSDQTELYLIKVSKSGNGSIVSNPAGIDCGTECESFFESGKTIILNAVPSSSSSFVRWEGDCSSCGSSSSCKVTVNTDKECKAVFSSGQQNRPPVINQFKVSSTTGQLPLTVTFSWSVSDPDGDSLNCKLDVNGDGNYDYNFDNCSQQSVQHVYTKVGTYLATLFVKDTAGNIIKRTVQIIIKGSGNVNHNPTVLYFKANPTSGDAPLTVTFNWKVADPDGDKVECKFDVNGDGVFDYFYDNCSEETLQYTYTDPGSYDSHLVVVDGRGGFYQVNAMIYVSPQQEPELYLLKVEKGGNGDGTIESEPAGIDCGTECESFFEENKDVTLIAHIQNGTTFGGWQGDCSSCGTNTTCIVKMTTDKVCRAVFNKQQQNRPPVINHLNVNPTSGEAPLTVTFSWDVSDPDGDNLTCKIDANNDNIFDYVENNCSKGSFQYVYSQAGTYNAKFIVIDSHGNEKSRFTKISVSSIPHYTITINKKGDGNGTVVSNPPGINCGSTCSANFQRGTLVRLTVSVASNSIFDGWGGSCSSCGLNKVCNITVSSNMSCDVKFKKKSISGNFSNFKRTSFKVDYKTNMNGVCRKTFGLGWRLADWKDLENFYRKGGDLAGLLDYLGMKYYPARLGGDLAWVSYNGREFYTSTRHYYIERHDHVRSFLCGYGRWPSGGCFLVHAQLDNHLIDLGSWYGNMSVLCYYEGTVSTKTLVVRKEGNGNGTITSSTGDINCGSKCSATFYSTTTLTLYARPNSGSQFRGWGRDCSSCGSGSSCTITVNKDKVCTARFVEPSSNLIYHFKLTKHTYKETVDVNAKCRAEFGSNWRIADWNDIVYLQNQHVSLVDFLNKIGAKFGDVGYVTANGRRYWSGRRHYFIARHDHKKDFLCGYGRYPSGGCFLVHAQLDNHLIDLGSWYDMNMPILCTDIPPNQVPYPVDP